MKNVLENLKFISLVRFILEREDVISTKIHFNKDENNGEL